MSGQTDKYPPHLSSIHMTQISDPEGGDSAFPPETSNIYLLTYSMEQSPS